MFVALADKVVEMISLKSNFINPRLTYYNFAKGVKIQILSHLKFANLLFLSFFVDF